MKLEIDPSQVADEAAQDALEIIKNTWAKEPFLSGSFRFYELAFTASGTFKVAHRLGFKPVDIIQSSLIGAGALTWNYANFDSTNLNVTVTGACTVRAFIGAYRE